MSARDLGDDRRDAGVLHEIECNRTDPVGEVDGEDSAVARQVRHRILATPKPFGVVDHPLAIVCGHEVGYDEVPVSDESVRIGLDRHADRR